jgi:16S rRNA (guanine966-N2)-methyltransferase
MRIIAGRLGGRVYDTPGTHRTHPMSDKVKGALFNVLGDIGGLTVLDAFAGSGALSFEAASRGAAHVVAIDNDRSAQITIEQNIRSLNLRNKVKLIKASANAWLSTNEDALFDIVLCDPPYDNLQNSLLVRLAERVTLDGLIVLSLPPNADVSLPSENYKLEIDKDYGDARLVFYRRIR